jgi:uncharacterized repeat protein (TIGR03803 family)
MEITASWYWNTHFSSPENVRSFLNAQASRLGLLRRVFGAPLPRRSFGSDYRTIAFHNALVGRYGSRRDCFQARLIATRPPTKWTLVEAPPRGVNLHGRSISREFMRRHLPLHLILLSFLSAGACMPAAGQTYSVIYNADAQDTVGAFIQAGDGNFYGTGNLGGTAQLFGSVFRLTPQGSYTLLHSFCASGNSACPQGELPGPLVQGRDGNLYGVTSEGDGVSFSGGAGTIFKITPAGVLKTIHQFCETDCTDGERPFTQLIQDGDGNFWGTTGGYEDAMVPGTIFKMTSVGALTTMHAFCIYPCVSDVASTGLVQASDGNFYGTTGAGGGPYDGGTVFQLTPSGAFTSLYNFCTDEDVCPNGYEPFGSLVEGPDGDLYGTTSKGGSGGGGTVYKISTSGVVTNLFSFDAARTSPNGYVPSNTIFLASDGNFYGGTYYGDSNGNGSSCCGTLFSITPAGTLTTLLILCPDYSSGPCPDGKFIDLGPIQGADGNIYGPASESTTNAGVYQFTPATPLSPPVTVVASPSTLTLGTSSTVSWAASNAYSQTMQLCENFVNGLPYSAAGPSGSFSFTPNSAGIYHLATSCGGVETGLASLTVLLPSTTTVAVSPNPASVGQEVSLTATVSGAGAKPTGTAKFKSEGLTLATETLVSGATTYTATTTGISVGDYTVTAAYSGGTTYAASSSPSYSVALVKAPTSTTLTANPAAVTPPGSVTLTANVTRTASGATGTPGGSVTFFYASIALGTASVNGSGVAILLASSSGIAKGSYLLTAKYSGDANDVVSSSSAVTVAVE